MIDGREVGNVDFNNTIIGHQTSRVTMRMDRRSHTVAELIADKLLHDRRRRHFPIKNTSKMKTKQNTINDWKRLKMIDLEQDDNRQSSISDKVNQ